MKNFKTITPNTTASLELNDDQLALVAAITGQNISIGHAPLIGKYINIGGKRTCTANPSHKELDIRYECQTSGENEGKITRIYIGSEIHGPMLSWDCDAGWRNLYGHGNHGKNGACGGNWSSESRRTYPTMMDAINDRDFMVTGLLMNRSRLIEGPTIVEALRELAGLE